MNNEELDQLKAKNEKRIKEIEDRYFEANAGILTAKQILRERADKFETREKFKDASINYPTYGRGIAMPGVDLDTFMIQKGMCEDTKKKQRAGSGSPKADV